MAVVKLTGTVTYTDGREQPFVTGMAGMAAWELYALRHGYPTSPETAPRALYALVLAHHAIGVQEGFDVWYPTVLGVDLEADEVPPTLKEASAG